MIISNISAGESCRFPFGQPPVTNIYTKAGMITKCSHKIDMDQMNKYVPYYSIQCCSTIITVLFIFTIKAMVHGMYVAI